METRMAFCATCDRPVRVLVKPEAAGEPGGEVNPDDVVCLEHGETCGSGTVCPIFDVPSDEMRAKLDTHLRAEQGGAS